MKSILLILKNQKSKLISMWNNLKIELINCVWFIIVNKKIGGNSNIFL